jgi:hypothetical protein
MVGENGYLQEYESDLSARDLDILEFMGPDFRVVTTMELARYIYPKSDAWNLAGKAGRRSVAGLRGHATTNMRHLYRGIPLSVGHKHPLVIPLGADLSCGKWAITSRGQEILREHKRKITIFRVGSPTQRRDADTEYMEHMLVWLDDLASGNNIAEYLSFCAMWAGLAEIGAFFKRTHGQKYSTLEIFVDPSPEVMEATIHVLAVCMMHHVLVAPNGHPRENALTTIRSGARALGVHGNHEQRARAQRIMAHGREQLGVWAQRIFGVHLLCHDCLKALDGLKKDIDKGPS